MRQQNWLNYSSGRLHPQRWSRRTKVGVTLGAFLVAVYLLGPVVASIFEVGDRAGPKIYPHRMHEDIYLLAWDLYAHEDKKPRLGPWFRDEYRPLFYGMYSKNNDPVWIASQIMKLNSPSGATQPESHEP